MEEEYVVVVCPIDRQYVAMCLYKGILILPCFRVSFCSDVVKCWPPKCSELEPLSGRAFQLGYIGVHHK